MDFSLTWCPYVGAAAPNGYSLSQTDLGGGSAGGRSRPGQLFSFVALDCRTQKAGDVRAGWWWQSGRSPCGRSTSKPWANALSWLLDGTNGGDTLWRHVFLEGVVMAVLSLLRFGFSGEETPDPLDRVRATCLVSLTSLCLILDVRPAGGTIGGCRWSVATNCWTTSALVVTRTRLRFW